jgi:diguanylate cyclase (GGDEF)-like protein
MVNLENNAQKYDASEVLHWDRFLSGRAPSLDQVAALAGDRELLESEKIFFDELKARRGARFFQDLLFVITHQSFSPVVAEELWLAILRHKYELSELLKRNIRITVAALDYLGNLKGTLRSATVINEDHAAAMAHQTMHDGLTRLFNHASFFHKLELELSFYALSQKTVALMMMDIDDFKEINDRYGHHAGDLVLAALGPMIESMMRATDICCRYGGEEFAVILPSTNAQEAGLLAERLCAKLEQSLPGGQEITVSIGVAACDGHVHTALELVEKADAALYQAKRAGKNRVVISTGESPIQASRVAAIPADRP